MNTRQPRTSRQNQAKPFVSGGFANFNAAQPPSEVQPNQNSNATQNYGFQPTTVNPPQVQREPPQPPIITVQELPIKNESNNPFDNESVQSGEDGTRKKFWYRNGNKKKPSVREKRIRRNRTLRKILTPKNALMALYELKGNKLSDYKISPDGKGFIAEVLVNNVRYEGRGISKIVAKNNASEKALRDLIIQKMVLKPKQAASNDQSKSATVSEAGDDDVEMKEDDNNDTEEVPMMHLASFALHKLFTEWQADGFDIPDFRATHGQITGAAANDKSETVRKPIPERTELPPNAESMHPSMLLSVMRPATQYVELGSEGNSPNSIIHRMGVTIGEQQFIGSARSKKLARKAAAIEACNALFNTSFAREDLAQPTQVTV